MKQKISKVLVTSLLLMLVSIVSISAKVGWTNDGWSGLSWFLKACNSKTKVYDKPSYSYMSATAKIGSKQDRKEKKNPESNASVHAVAKSGYNETCQTWGNAY